MITVLDRAWLAAHPLPATGAVTTKNARGRVLAVGGSLLCPGALRLTAEAALRSGAGKVQMASVAPAAIGLGLALPEAAAIALPVDEHGEIAVAAVDTILGASGRCDAFVLGPGMGHPASAKRLLGALLPALGDHATVFDAAALGGLAHRAAAVRALRGHAVLTPHHGEMARLIGRAEADVAAAAETLAADCARTFGAVVALKGGSTVIAGPDRTLLSYPGGGPGLGTGGSGDVLAGLIGGLLARGADPLVATAWGIWLHGEAGRILAERVGPLGFLAREIAPLVPRLMAGPFDAAA